MTQTPRRAWRALLRLAAVAPVLASLTVVTTVTRVGPSLQGCAQASPVHHAALVVEHGDGSVIRRCVAFAEDSISGATLLARSGVQYGTGYSGQAVCQIDSEPASYDPNGCLAAGSPYWAMYVSRAAAAWVYSSSGFASQQFRDGDAEGFRYEGQGDGTTPPSPSGICPAPALATIAPTRSPTPATHRSTVATSSPTPPVVAASAVPTPSSPPTADLTASPGPARAVTAGSHSAPSSGAGTGTWVAVALAAVLLAALFVQLLRTRRRGTQRSRP